MVIPRMTWEWKLGRPVVISGIRTPRWPVNLYATNVFCTLILEFTISGPHKFQMDSIISQNSKFRGPVDHIKNWSGNPVLNGDNYMYIIMPYFLMQNWK